MNTNKEINIWADTILSYEDQLSYKKSFMEKFGDQMKNHSFYFDNAYLVDDTYISQPTIRGALLNENTCREFTNILIDYYNLQLI